MNNYTLKSNRKAEPALVTVILLILLILATMALIWRVVFYFIDQGSEEITYQNSCIRVKLEIVEVNNGSTNNLILRRGIGRGDLIGIKLFLDDKYLGDFQMNISQAEEKSFTIPDSDLKNNPKAVGKYAKIQKLIGKSLSNSKPCEFDGESAEDGIIVVSS